LRIRFFKSSWRTALLSEVEVDGAALLNQRFDLYGFDLAWETAVETGALVSRGSEVLFCKSNNSGRWEADRKVAVAQDCQKGLKPFWCMHCCQAAHLQSKGLIYSGSNNCPNVWLFWKDWLGINQVNYIIF